MIFRKMNLKWLWTFLRIVRVYAEMIIVTCFYHCRNCQRLIKATSSVLLMLDDVIVHVRKFVIVLVLVDRTRARKNKRREKKGQELHKPGWHPTRTRCLREIWLRPEEIRGDHIHVSPHNTETSVGTHKEQTRTGRAGWAILPNNV